MDMTISTHERLKQFVRSLVGRQNERDHWEVLGENGWLILQEVWRRTNHLLSFIRQGPNRVRHLQQFFFASGTFLLSRCPATIWEYTEKSYKIRMQGRGMDSSGLGWDQWRAHINAEMNRMLPLIAGNFFSTLITVSVSRRTWLHLSQLFRCK